MANALLQVRLDETLKTEAAQVFESLGIDTSTAIRMFLKRAVMERGIPFSMTLNKVDAEIESSRISEENKKKDI